jgi:protocatechuate 4,5-dioxygenase, alpha chain
MEQSPPGATYRGGAIPGTTVFTGARSQQGYRINRLAMSLTDPANRDAFKSDERSYMKRYGLSDAEMALVQRRDWTGLVDAGGNVYLLLKIAGTVGQNLLQMGAQMRGQTFDEFMRTRPGIRGAPRERSR